MITVDANFQGIGVDMPDVLDEVAKVIALSLEASLKRNTPIDTGRLRGNYQYERSGTGIYKITNNVNYVMMVNDGTGIYGPSGKPIEPVTAKCLMFTVGGSTIFRRSVKGQKGQGFVEKSIGEAESNAQSLARIAVDRILNA